MKKGLLMITHIAALAAAGYLGFCALVFFRQGAMLYFPDRSVKGTPAGMGLPYERFSVTTADGETVTGWFVPGRTETNAVPPTVLFCHGNAGDIADRLPTIGLFHEMGVNVAIFDYRGYGQSTGKPTEPGTYEDAAAAWNYLVRDREIPPDRIVLYGRSLGAAVAAWLAERVDAAGLVLESAFTSAPDMAARMIRYLPARVLCRFKYNTQARLAAAGCPVLIAHSRQDEMIPFAHGHALFEAAAEPKTFVEVEGTHNVGGIDVDAGYRRKLTAFIRQATESDGK